VLVNKDLYRSPIDRKQPTRNINDMKGWLSMMLVESQE